VPVPVDPSLSPGVYEIIGLLRPYPGSEPLMRAGIFREEVRGEELKEFVSSLYWDWLRQSGPGVTVPAGAGGGGPAEASFEVITYFRGPYS